jgi:hypothetical protein
MNSAGVTGTVESAPAPPGLDDRAALVALCRLLAGVSATCVLSLLIFYAVELRSDGLHVFGPTSDLTTSLWNLLLVPLLIASAGVLRSHRARALIGLTATVSVLGAVMSMLLVIDAVPFGLSTPISVVAVLAQAAWLFTVSGSLRRPDQRATGPVTLGRLMGAGQWGGALVVGISFVFDWGSVPQMAIMGIGLAPGLLSWLSWPVWFWLVAHALARAGTAVPRQRRRTR